MRKPKTKLYLRAIPPAIEEREGSYYITQSSVPLSAVLGRFKEGLSPETIRRDCFPSLPLVSIYSVVSFYLNHQEQVEKYLQQVQQEAEEQQQYLLSHYPAFIKTAEELREHITPKTEA